jgi:TatD DNase family protein
MTKGTLSLFDIGANLTHSSFTHDLDDVIARASAHGVNKIALTGTDLETTRQAIELCGEFPDLFIATAGVHPHDADDFDQGMLAELGELSTQPAIRAIGETGLDFNRNYSTPANQETAFEQQLELACQCGLPLFLHERDAHQRLHEILSHYRNHFSRAVVHCFTGTREEMYRYLDLDLHIGITGWICDERRGRHLHEFVKDIPSNRLMIETDAPYLLPRDLPDELKPEDKRRNEPCTLGHILRTIAVHVDKSEEQLARETFETACTFFGLENYTV